MQNLSRRHVIRRIAVLGAALLVPTLLCGGAAAQKATLQTFEKSALEIRSGDKTHRFTVELARTSAQQMQGLMFRRRMAADAGMLFIYRQPQIARFWMKNTYIPLDMLFIAADGRVSSIAERTVPLSLETVASEGPVLAVLELNGGTASRLGIHVGDRVIHPAFGSGR